MLQESASRDKRACVVEVHEVVVHAIHFTRAWLSCRDRDGEANIARVVVEKSLQERSLADARGATDHDHAWLAS
eukprot:41258-Pleurochrysis_carterae.AAC.1